MTTLKTRTGKTLRWTGANISHCWNCDLTFSSVGSFDKHLKRPRDKNGTVIQGPAEHVHPARLGMVENERGHWGTPVDLERLTAKTTSAKKDVL